jgi:hypothetical protein
MPMRHPRSYVLLSLLLSLVCRSSIGVEVQPPDLRRELFQGVTYVRESRLKPRPLVIRVLLVDLNAPGVSVFVTPAERVKGGRVRARTTSQFLQAFHLQAAVNASNFTPYRSASPTDYYPRAGDPVTPDGSWASNGHVYARGDDVRFPAIYITRDNRVSFESPARGLWNATAGKGTMIDHGVANVQASPVNHTLHPRTAVAVDQVGKTLILLVVDGRQAGYSEGVTVAELADIAREFGAYSGINLDGGGSTAMVVAGQRGKAEVLNSPIDHGVPGSERCVATHLGIRACPLMHGSGGSLE